MKMTQTNKKKKNKKRKTIEEYYTFDLPFKTNLVFLFYFSIPILAFLFIAIFSWDDPFLIILFSFIYLIFVFFALKQITRIHKIKKVVEVSEKHIGTIDSYSGFLYWSNFLICDSQEKKVYFTFTFCPTSDFSTIKRHKIEFIVYQGKAVITKIGAYLPYGEKVTELGEPDVYSTSFKPLQMVFNFKKLLTRFSYLDNSLDVIDKSFLDYVDMYNETLDEDDLDL